MALRRSSFFRFLALVTAAGIVISSASALADDSDGDGISDEIEAATTRNLTAAGVPEGHFNISSRSVGAATDDEFQVYFEAGTFGVEYRPNADSDDRVWYELGLRRIIEFVDDGGEISGNDIVQTWDLTNMYWRVDSYKFADDDGGRQFLFNSTLLGDFPPAGFVVVSARASERFVRIGGGLVTPMEVKVTIMIIGWPLKRADTKLGLKLEIGTLETHDARIETGTLDEARGWASDESQLNVSSPLGFLFFSWSNTARVDSVERPVRATDLSPTEGGLEFYLVYDPGTVIFHDPKMGVESSAFWSQVERIGEVPLEWNPILYIAGLGAISGVVALTVFARRRRRERQ